MGKSFCKHSMLRLPLILRSGVGTNFTNDFRIADKPFTRADPDAAPRSGEVSKPLNIVIKISRVKGVPAVKISDELTKNTGDKEEIRLVKERFHLEEPEASAASEAGGSSSAVRTPKPRLPLLILVITTSVLLRLLLFSIPGLTDILEGRLELGDPFSSWPSVLNTVWALDPPPHIKTTSPYPSSSSSLDLPTALEGGMGPAGTTRAIPAPLLILVLSPVLPGGRVFRWLAAIGLSDIIRPSALLYVLLDALSTALIYRIASLRLRSPMSAESSTSRKIPTRLSARRLLQSLTTYGVRLTPNPALVASIYAFHPLILLTCLAKSGTSLTLTALLFCLWGAMEGSASSAAAGLSVASMLAVHPLLLLPAVVLLCCRQTRYWRHCKGRRIGKRKADPVSDWLMPLFAFTMITAVLAGVSAAFVSRCNGSTTSRDWTGLVKVYRGL